MRRRYSYPLLYAIPALVVAVTATAIAAATLAGVLWLFVYGDNTWPAWVSRVAQVFMIVVLFGTWSVLMLAAFRWGKREEASTSFNIRHAYVALGSTLALFTLLVLHQLSIGNFGPKPPSSACMDWCQVKGYSASHAARDGTCRCYGQTGQARERVPMEQTRVH